MVLTKKYLAVAIALGVIAFVGVMVYLLSRVERVEQTGGPEEDRVLFAEGYVGAERCGPCHGEAFETWSHSAHAEAMAVATPETVKGDFEEQTTHEFDGQTYRMFVKDGRYFIEAPNRDGLMQTYPVVYTLGARQHENYLTRFPDGRLQVLPVYYDLNQKRWFDAAEGTLEIGHALRGDAFYFWANHGRTWNTRCFDCHASQMRKNYDLKTDTYRSVVGDLSINCEACHGPGAAHVAFWRAAAEDPQLAMQPDRSLPDLSSLSPQQQVEACAQCHALKIPLRSGYVPGDDYWDYYELRLIDTDDAFWPDGLAKKLAYPYLQFGSSACFLKAGLTCTGCHATHGSSRRSELIADPRGVGLCARCHPDIAADVNGHTHHKATGPGGDCQACHLPQQFRNQLVMTDHRIAVPVPENTARLGIPNACGQSGCHADRSAEWASEKARAWYGDYQDVRVAHADAIHRGREGDTEAVGALQAMLSSELPPLTRAGVIAILGTLGDARVVGELTHALADSHSAVRAQAAVALGRIGHPRALPYLVAALGDSVFSVQIRAAYSLARMDYVPKNGEDKARYTRALDAFRAIVSGDGLLADDAFMHLNVGQIHEFDRAFDQARNHYAHALRFAPGLADAQDRMQRLLEDEARYKKLVEMLTPAVEKDMRARIALGLARIHRGEVREGIALLNVDARSELVQTGLGDAYRALGNFERAKQHYKTALEMAREFPGAHRGLALIAYSQGDSTAGKAHWNRFVQGRDGASDGVKRLMGR